ncbi:two pore channel protein 1-like [Xenia sp. Carnegie-2017]|uniref:two pore channel protein 1-like n=1 Tax=Xenia sp. Carnegie-2017 TaxID=2897299 RepID=UPI001F04568D|nr:two pore channel protein 1-like [Xenia sp. Carnegie-2017]
MENMQQNESCQMENVHDLHEENDGSRCCFPCTWSLIDRQKQKNDYIYQEAAIYLEKGEANELYHEFNDHLGKYRFMCYLIVHSKLYKIVDIFTSVGLLALAAVEPPAKFGMTIEIWIHGVLEIVFLFIVFSIFVIKIKWQGIKYSKTHKRTIFKFLFIVIMTVEVIVVMIRNDSHFRVTRALRPLFLLDTYYFCGVRRVLRTILKSLVPVLDIFALLLFFMIIFSILGFYFFSTNEDDPNFSTIHESFINLFILVTTANFPDVMMPAYHKNKGSAFFFVIYISIALYFLMNLVLATVYSTFSLKNKKKFKDLYFHKQKGVELAFKKIKEIEPNEGGIDLVKFCGLMKYFKPRMSPLSKKLLFKHLDKGKTGKLNLEEFRGIYDASKLSWHCIANDTWFELYNMPAICQKILNGIHYCVTKEVSCNFLFAENKVQRNVRKFEKISLELEIRGMENLRDQHEENDDLKCLFARKVREILKGHNCSFKLFDILIFAVIFANGCVVTVEVIMQSIKEPSERNLSGRKWHSHVFTSIYTVEALLKLLAFGIRGYFDSFWNWFDLSVTILNILESFDTGLTFAIFLRPIRLLLLFKLFKTYRVIFDSLRILLPSLVNLGIVIILFYYFFAIIGMEIFAGVDLKSCCRNDSILYQYEENGYYYLNNFNNFYHSFVTLFELTAVNNWHVIMEGFAQATTEWSRIFFMIFYIVILAVMTIVVAFILDAFTFSIKFQSKHQNVRRSQHKIKCEISLTKEEFDDPRYSRLQSETFKFVGKRVLTRDDLYEKMYSDELKAESCLKKTTSCPAVFACLQ